MKTLDILFEFAKDYDKCMWIERKESNENLYAITRSLLDNWARNVPEDKFQIIRQCLQRPIDYIVNREFTIESISLREKEISVVYLNSETQDTELRFTITPKLFLIRDVQRDMKELAFPYY